MKIQYLFALLVTAILVGGCGLTKTTEDTLGELKVSNKTQEDLLKATQAVLQGINQTNKGVALQGLLSPSNTEILTPPFRMMPFAEAFATEATASEVVQVFHVLISEALIGFDRAENGNKRVQARMVAFTAASAIAAFAQQEKIDAILSSQIEQRGRFEDTAYLLALCRYNFVRDYFLKAILGSPTANIGSLRATVGYFSLLKFLGTRPYVGKLKLKLEQIIPVGATYRDLTSELQPAEVTALAGAAVRRFQDPNTGLPQEVLASAEAKALLAQLQ